MKYRDFIDLMEEIAPTAAYKDIDNSGPQIRCGDDESSEINTVLVCLEINKDVISEAVDKKADMILTHHPLIFDPQTFIDYGDYPGRYIHECIRKGINVYSSHLPFDFADKGNNAYLAELLGLTSVCPGSLEEAWSGNLPETMNLEQVCAHVQKCLDLPDNYIRCVDGGNRTLHKVGLCTGAGGSYIQSASAQGCDLFVTGDLKLHEAQYAKAAGISVIDAGHYGTEKIFVWNVSQQLHDRAVEKGLDIDVIMAEANTNPYTL